MEADKLSMKRLVLVKQILRHGIVHKDSKSYIGRMLAVHHFDFAIETFLKITGTILDEHINLSGNFWSIWNEVNKKYKQSYDEELILRNQIKRLRRARNNVQHDAIIPSYEDLENYESYTISFIDNTLSNIYNFSLKDIKLIEIIEDKTIKKYLEKANTHLENNKFTWSVVASSIAFTYAKEIAKKKFMGTKGTSDFYLETLYDAIGSEDYYKLENEFDKLHEKIALLALNIDYSRYTKFIKKMIETNYGWNGEQLRVDSRVTKPLFGDFEDLKSKEDAEFCYDFVLDFTIETGL